MLGERPKPWGSWSSFRNLGAGFGGAESMAKGRAVRCCCALLFCCLCSTVLDVEDGVEYTT